MVAAVVRTVVMYCRSLIWRSAAGPLPQSCDSATAAAAWFSSASPQRSVTHTPAAMQPSSSSAAAVAVLVVAWLTCSCCVVATDGWPPLHDLEPSSADELQQRATSARSRRTDGEQQPLAADEHTALSDEDTSPWISHVDRFQRAQRRHAMEPQRLPALPSEDDIHVHLSVGEQQQQRSSDSEHGAASLGDDEGPIDDVLTSVPQLEHLVTSLRSQLKHAQATQMRTRSIINVMQEKQLAHERDMSVLKGDLAQLRRDLDAERQLVQALRAHAADASWAIADVKQGQDQVSSDVAVLKRRQELVNETLRVVEEIIMSNALELVSHNKHAVAVRQDIASLQGQTADQRGQLDELQDALETHLAAVPAASSIQQENLVEAAVSSENALPGTRPATAAARLYAPELRLRSTNQQPDDDTADQSQASGDRHVHQAGSRRRHHSTELINSMQTQLGDLAGELAQLRDRVSTLDARVSEAVTEVNVDESFTQHSPDVAAQLLQQAFINFTQHIYQQLHSISSESSVEPSQSSSSVVVRQLESRLSELNTSLAETRSAVEHGRLSTEQTLSELTDTYGVWTDRQHQLELMLINSSLEQCRRANSELQLDVQLAQLTDKTNAIDSSNARLTAAVHRVETDVDGHRAELGQHSATISSLSKQLKLVRHTPRDVTTLRSDLLNIVSQLPHDCSAALSDASRPDGVYVIQLGGAASPDLGNSASDSETARVYCERDAADATGWTLIQRRDAGRLSFARGWADYAAGFGDVSGEHWLGNELISRLTSRRRYRLRVDMWDAVGRYWVAEYARFRVAGADELYRLDLGGGGALLADEAAAAAAGGGGGYSHGVGGSKVPQSSAVGNATDALSYSDGQPFSAVDRDHDVSTTDCARFYAAGWWYKHCHYANLNGRFTAGMVWFNEERDEWLQMRRTVMKIAAVTDDFTAVAIAAASPSQQQQQQTRPATRRDTVSSSSSSSASSSSDNELPATHHRDTT